MKSCGEGGMCCKLLAIAPLDKAAGDWCVNFKPWRRLRGLCRPATALHGLHVPMAGLSEAGRRLAARPGTVPDVHRQGGRRLNFIVDPASPMAWQHPPYYARIKALSRRVLDGFELVVCIDTRRIVIFPHEDVDLGLVNPDHKIVSGYAERDGQSLPYAWC